jgi:branched-chain amino acid transport system permease protein
MNTFIQLLLSGVMMGVIYSLIALGVVLIYKSSSIFNFAQGEFMMVSGYIFWFFLVRYHLPLWASFFCLFIFCVFLGVMVERIFLRPLVGQPLLSPVIMTFGLAIMIRGIVVMVWGSDWQMLPEIFPEQPLRIGTIVLSVQLVDSFFVTLIFVGVLTCFFQFTRKGLAMRAVAESHPVAQSMGISLTAVLAQSWVISAIVAGVGGFLLGSISGINVALSDLGLKAIPVMLIGGLESIPGAIIAGPIIGVFENLASGYLDPLVGGGLNQVIPYVILILVLLIKPQGIFGLKHIERI